jgi:RHS repeat-associated protein
LPSERDLNGNLTSDGTSTYTWNARNELAAITGPTTASFAYDTLGRRRQKTIAGTTTSFLYDGLNGIQEATGSEVTNVLTALGVDESLMRTDGEGTRGLLSDGLGSTLALTANGEVVTEYTYEAFGATGAASTNPSQYTGRENDGTGVYYYRARYYDPLRQRFISEDPLRFGAGDLNLYNYVFNHPTGLRDPSGMAVDPISWTAATIMCGGGATVGMVVATCTPKTAPQRVRVDSASHDLRSIRSTLAENCRNALGVLSVDDPARKAPPKGLCKVRVHDAVESGP